MFSRTGTAVALALGLALLTSTGRAQAGPDVCPEPNSSAESACFLGPGTAVPGYLDAADDVDAYRLELGADQMIVATLGGLPADYSLRLHLADGSIKAEALEPGRADKVVRADGLPAGTYFLSVSSLRGESSASDSYTISVAYPASLVITTPAGASGVPEAAYGYIPAPAKAYGISVDDIGPGFREIERDEAEDGRAYANRIVAPDAAPLFGMWMSRNHVGTIDTTVIIYPYGSNDDLGQDYNRQLEAWRARGVNVQPAVGWGSEQVHSYAAAGNNVMYRGIALRHRNAVVFMEMLGFEQHATWDAISRLMRVVEGRIWAAAE